MDLSFRSPKTAVRNSPIHGNGLFAIENILKDEIVAVKGGYVFSKSELVDIEKRMGSSEIQISEDKFIGPVNEDEKNGGMLYLNHSCNPNVGIQGQIVFVAMRDINDGDELTHDWATTDNDDYELRCNCYRLQYLIIIFAISSITFF